jgi:hypothetical protein
MESDCRSRQGQSYSSMRRRISHSVDAALNLATSDPCSSFQTVDLLRNVECPIEGDILNDFDIADCNSQFEDCNAGCADNVTLNDTESCYDSIAGVSDSSFVDSESELDSFSSDMNINILPLRVQLAEWAMNNNISHSALASLLNILKPYHDTLPVDPRTLLKTPQTYDIKIIEGPDNQVGQYYHFGIACGIAKMLTPDSPPAHSVLSLQFNFDGLPLFKSSNLEFWPIQCLIRQYNVRPFVVGLYCGCKKPGNITQYLHDFVSELTDILMKGITVLGIQLTVKIDCFVCDAPARSFVKNVKAHNGYHGCEKCVQEGVYINRRMTFPETASKCRTDDDFRNMMDEEHHRGPTPLSDLPIGLVTDFVFDYMHLVCLGVVRKLVKFWLGGSLHTSDEVASRLSSSKVQLLSDKLANVRQFTPREFARRPRGLSEVDRLKATEFRQLLMYTGPIILSGVLVQNVYQHFLLLFTAITLLTSPVLCQDYCDYAHSLLVAFVELASTLYGSDFIVYNVHGLIHLADDANRHGSLDNFSAFPFENQMKALKRLVRKAGSPLAQVVRRLGEQGSFSFRRGSSANDSASARDEHRHGPVPDGFSYAKQFSLLKVGHFMINVKRSPADCCVVVRDNKRVLVVNVLEMKGSLFIVCNPFKGLTDLFAYPLPSSSIGIYKASGVSKELLVMSVSEIMCKCFFLPCNPVGPSMYPCALLPLVHSVTDEQM